MKEVAKISEPDTYRLIAELLAEDPQSVSADVELESLDGWDSMGALMIMAEMDERFDLTVTEAQFEAMTRVSDLVDLLRANELIVDA